MTGFEIRGPITAQQFGGKLLCSDWFPYLSQMSCDLYTALNAQFLQHFDFTS
jgi:hypothetical protein